MSQKGKTVTAYAAINAHAPAIYAFSVKPNRIFAAKIAKQILTWAMRHNMAEMLTIFPARCEAA
jgi:hypothetical protein